MLRTCNALAYVYHVLTYQGSCYALSCMVTPHGVRDSACIRLLWLRQESESTLEGFNPLPTLKTRTALAARRTQHFGAFTAKRPWGEWTLLLATVAEDRLQLLAASRHQY